MVRIETHCHSHHSFDCNTAISDIISTCLQREVKGIVICDHDVCDITEEEETSFKDNGIRLYKAIEFTTKTDAHVIGISPRIKELQQERFHYELDELIDKLQSIGAAIIIPHPNHGTGIVGNGKIEQGAIEKAFLSAHFVEKENYRYGKTSSDIIKKYSKKSFVMGSDAHASKNVGAFVNLVGEIKDDFLATMQSGKISYYKNDEHGRGYWIMKSVKASAPYQFLLKLFPDELRRNIKNKIINK